MARTRVIAHYGIKVTTGSSATVSFSAVSDPTHWNTSLDPEDMDALYDLADEAQVIDEVTHGRTET